jgi:hypothetical protein
MDVNRPVMLPQAVVAALVIVVAAYLGYTIGSAEFSTLITIAVAAAILSILGFVGDYWWAPLVLISALTFRTNFLGFMMTGLDIGVVVLVVLLPLKLAVRRLRLVLPRLRPGKSFLLLFGYVTVHAVAIILWNKYHGVPLKNIIKAYYSVLAPLCFYPLLLRYCNPRTVRRTAIWTFAIYAFVIAVSVPVIWSGAFIPFLNGRYFLFDWTHASVALAAVRSYSPLLLAAMIAVWPATRSPLAQALVLAVLLVAVIGTLISASRAAMVMCLIEIAVFLVLRHKLWLLVPFIIATAGATFIISSNPDVLYDLPVPIHRALTPFNLSSHHTAVQNAALASDQWHEDLRRDSFTYWTSDLWSFLVGHGFKPWDESFNTGPEFTAFYEDAKRVAIQMGRTENLFSAVTNIFGVVGLVLYAALFWQIARTLLEARRAAAAHPFAKAVADFSFVTLLTSLVFALFAGGVPGINIIYWQLGILACRNYLGHTVKRAPDPKLVSARDLVAA